MSEQPPPIPLKYRMAGAEAASAASGTPPPLPPPPRRSRVSHWELLFRIVIVLLIIGSAGVAYWSFFHRLTPLQQEARAMTTKVSTLSTKLDGMERQWPPEQVDEVRTLYRQVYGQLFADQAALQEWLGQVQALAEPLALDISVGFGQNIAQEGFTNNLAVIPASISLEVLPTEGDIGGKTPYERMLTFSQALAGHGKRADLAELTVAGGVGSINRALLVFNLWAGDLGSEAEAEAQPTTAATAPAKPNPGAK